MNIVVITSNGKTVVRPDTTWERDGDDLYVPEFIDSVSYSPVFTAHVCKAGRRVDARFAHRYFDAVGFGVLLYPDQLLDGSEEGFASASCLDHSSFIIPPQLAPGTAGTGFDLLRDGERIFSSEIPETGMIVRAVSDATRYCYIRRGDIIAVELQERRPLCSRDQGECRMDEVHCGTHACDYRIIF